LQYGRFKQHLQACDVLLDQINARAALPERLKLETPAGISREVRIKHCETPSYVTPQSPFDVALNLSFDTPRTVYQDQDQVYTDRFKLFDSQICSQSSEACSSLDSQPQSKSQVFSLGRQSSPVQLPDGGFPDNALNDPEPCCSELKALLSSSPGNIAPPVACISEDKVSTCSGSVPEKLPQLRPKNLISASYHVEQLSNSPSFSPHNPTRRTSFCRIEAFVLRSKSNKPMPLQHGVGVPNLKK